MVIGKFISPDCDKLGVELIEAYGALSYAHSRVVQHYTGDAIKFVRMALEHLQKTGLDREDLEPILEPLKKIETAESIRTAFPKPLEPLNPVALAAHIDSAQEEILRWAPNFIAACECSKRK